MCKQSSVNENSLFTKTPKVLCIVLNVKFDLELDISRFSSEESQKYRSVASITHLGWSLERAFIEEIGRLCQNRIQRGLDIIN